MALIVTGVHRSGTSMVAGVLAKLGISMGEGAVMAAAPENPDGFYERIDVMQLNDAILQELGGSWEAPPNLGVDAWNSFGQAQLATYRSRIELLSGLFSDWFVKDPRISLLLPLWDRLALTNLPLIYAVRNPKDVAQSLHLRNGMSHRRALAIWWTYNQSILTNIDSRESLVIDYDIAKRSKRNTTEQIASFALKSVLATKGTKSRLETGMNEIEDHLFESIKTGEASRVITPKLSRSSGTRTLRGLSSNEIEETLDLYLQLKRAHGVVNPKMKSTKTPDWVFEELYNSRVEWKLTQLVTSISDELETSKIQLATQEKEAHLTSTAQSEELDRLKSHLITLEAERDNLLIHKVEVDNVIEKSRVSLQSLSFELLEKSKQTAKLMEENENLSTEVRELSEHISSLSDHFSARNLAAQNRITGLEQSLQRMAAQLGVELVNLRVKQQEIELIRSSRGYRLLSWIWRRKS